MENGLDPGPFPAVDGIPNDSYGNEPAETEGIKNWERPWNIGEMRQSSKNWTLAADSGVSGGVSGGILGGGNSSGELMFAIHVVGN